MQRLEDPVPESTKYSVVNLQVCSTHLGAKDTTIGHDERCLVCRLNQFDEKLATLNEKLSYLMKRYSDDNPRS